MELYSSRENPYKKVQLVLLVLAGVLAGIILARLFVTPYRVPDITMQPAIQKGELAWFLKVGSPGKGEIVLYQSPLQPGHYMAGRIVAIAEDMVEVRDKTILINGKPLKGDWKVTWEDERKFPMKFSQRDSMPTMKVPMRSYFIISDNLDFSMDSRSFGPVDRELIEGTLLFQ